jgi:CRP-like cAMP-binding protein
MSKRHRQARQAQQGEKFAVRLIDPERHVPEMLEYLRLIVGSREELDDMKDHWVHCLMACGVSFADIGAALGVSRQSVHSRYAGTIEPAKTNPNGSVLWMTPGAREAALGNPVNDA